MPNLLVNGDAESATPPPTLADGAARAAGGGYTGSWGFQLLADDATILGTPTRRFSSLEWTGLALSVSASHSVNLWHYVSGTQSSMRVKVDRGDGAYWTMGTRAYSDLIPLTWTAWELGSFEALGSTGRLKIETFGPFSPPEYRDAWLVDDVEFIGDEMALTQTLYTALLADMNDITTGNGFATDIGYVGGEPRTWEDIQNDLPAVILSSKAFDSDPDRNTVRTGEGIQQFLINSMVRSDTPNADIHALFDDIRNAIERQTNGSMTGNIGQVGAVSKVDVTEGEGPLAGPDVSDNVYFHAATVQITYKYTKGSL